MDLEAIPGLSDEVNIEVHSMNEEFSGQQNEQVYADITADGDSASVDLDRSVEDREEEVIVCQYFEGSPCCALGRDKGPCWTLAGREKFLHARQESMDLEKKELDLAVLAALRAFRSLPNDPSVSREISRASVKYSYEGMPICKSAFLFIHAIGS